MQALTPKPFGFPIAKHYKKRLAKKYIKSLGRNMWKRYKQFHNYKGLVSDCSGLNIQPLEITPVYVGDNKSKILWDLDIRSSNNSCSFYHCGIDLPKSYEECQEYIKYIIDTYKDHDEWKLSKRYKMIILKPDGTFNYGDST